MTELPVACCLSPGELKQREREISALFADALTGAQLDDRRLELRFGPGGDVLHRVEALASAERRCCAFLTFEVTGGDRAPALAIDAPAGAEDTLAGFAAVAREALQR